MFSTKRSNEKLPGPRGATLLAIAFALAASLAAPRAGFAQNCDVPTGAPVVVTALAPHFELKLADGRLVRIAGIEPVRATAGDADLPARAAADLELWSVGAQVALSALDPTPDRWGRIRARVFLPPDNPGLAAALIEAGWARVAPLSETPACLPALYKAEADARANRRGLWADPAYAVRDQAENPDYSGLVGQIVVVSGTVVNVNAGRVRTFVNFGADRHTSLTITLAARAVREFTAAGLPPQGLTGRTLRVRGLLDTRFGPRIDISTVGAIELLGAAPPDAGRTPVATPGHVDSSGWHAPIPAQLHWKVKNRREMSPQWHRNAHLPGAWPGEAEPVRSARLSPASVRSRREFGSGCCFKASRLFWCFCR